MHIYLFTILRIHEEREYIEKFYFVSFFLTLFNLFEEYWNNDLRIIFILINMIEMNRVPATKKINSGQFGLNINPDGEKNNKDNGNRQEKSIEVPFPYLKR